MRSMVTGRGYRRCCTGSAADTAEIHTAIDIDSERIRVGILFTKVRRSEIINKNLFCCFVLFLGPAKAATQNNMKYEQLF
jgi:hypothetical protein